MLFAQYSFRKMFIHQRKSFTKLAIADPLRLLGAVTSKLIANLMLLTGIAKSNTIGEEVIFRKPETKSHIWVMREKITSDFIITTTSDFIRDSTPMTIMKYLTKFHVSRKVTQKKIEKRKTEKK